MPIESLQATVRHDPPVAIIDLAGEINGASEEQLNSSYDQASGLYPRAIVLDFGRVGFINSTGIALIVAILARARKDGIPLITCRLSDHYREIFEITRLIDFVQVVPDLETAIESVAGHAERTV